jgi:hypothetical protein
MKFSQRRRDLKGLHPQPSAYTSRRSCLFGSGYAGLGSGLPEIFFRILPKRIISDFPHLTAREWWHIMPHPDRQPEVPARGRSIFASLAVPYTFKPDLGPGEAAVAVLGCLARIFGACLLFALWGGFSAFVWISIGSRFWRVSAVLPLVLIFPAALAFLMLAISAAEKKIRS